jgi:hypothetical protein
MTLNLAIGCPVYNRAWSLPRWFQCIFDQKISTKNTDLVFAYTEGEDNTKEILEKYGERFRSLNIIECNDIPAFGNRDAARFYPLVVLRNRILMKLRELQPDYYFSYDSDILLPEGTLKELVKDNKDIVAPWVALDLQGMIPNCATALPGGGFKRYKPYEQFYPQKGLYEVSTVFAVFLMKNPVFNTCTYKWHTGGEDFGFAQEVIKAGFTSWMHGDIVGTHLYKKDI